MSKEINTVNLIVGADLTIGLQRERPVYQETAKTAKMGRVGPQPFHLPSNLSHQKSRDIIQLETAVSIISQEYLLEFTSEYGISEDLHPELLGPEERIVDFPEGKVLYKTFGFPEKLEQSILLGGREGISYWHVSAPKDEMPAEDTYSPEVVAVLNTHSTSIQKQPEALLCLVGFSRRYFLKDDVYPTFLHDDDRDMDLLNLIRAMNPTKVKIGTRPRVAHEVPLLTVIASRVIEMEDPTTATDSSGIPSTIESVLLDFANEIPSHQSTRGDGTEDQAQETVAPEVPPPENVTTTGVAPETGLMEEITTTSPRVIKKRRKIGNDGVEANAPPKVLRKDHADSRPTQSTIGGKSLASMGLETGFTFPVPTPQETPAYVSDPDPLSSANPQSIPKQDVVQSSKGAAVAGDLESKNTSFTSMKAYTSRKMRHLHNDDFLSQYNMNLARQVAMGSQLRLRFEQEAKLLKKFVAQVARRDQRIQARENEIKNFGALLEAETDVEKAAEAKNAEFVNELENLRAQFTDLQVRNDRLSQQVSTLQAQVTGEEKLKAAFEDFKKYKDDRVEKRCAKMDACMDALSIDFDEELYPHMLTAIACRRWVIRHGLRLAVMKCGESTKLRQVFVDVVSAGIANGISEGLKYGVEHGKANLDLEAIEAYDPKADTKYVMAFHVLRDLKYPMVDQLESLKDAPIDVIMASLHLESDSGEDAPQWIRELRPSSSQLKIPVYPEKKKCRVVCRTHGVGSAHHARSDGVPVSVPTVAPQGLAILLADAATQRRHSRTRSHSPWPLGLQPSYTAGLLQEYLAYNYSGTVMDDK
nr:hypothetical protein [Tanacetum cinerariifolium]